MDGPSVACRECGKSLVLETSFLKTIAPAPAAKDKFLSDFSNLSRTLFPKYGINTCSQVQHLLAQAFAETTILTKFRESLIYTSKSYTPKCGHINLEGVGSVDDAAYALAKEFASVGVKKGLRISDSSTIGPDGKKIYSARYAEVGESYYNGDGANVAHISPEEITNALIESKTASSNEK